MTDVNPHPLVADLVTKLHTNIDSIHATLSSLTSTSSAHHAELERLSKERETKIAELRASHEVALKELAAQRQKDEEALQEQRRKEQEELELGRQQEYEELMAKRKAEDEERARILQEHEGTRLKAIEEEDKERENEREEQERSLHEKVEKELELLEDEMERKFEEGRQALKDLDEKRKAINGEIDAALNTSTMIPPMYFRSRAKTQKGQTNGMISPPEEPVQVDAKVIAEEENVEATAADNTVDEHMLQNVETPPSDTISVVNGSRDIPPKEEDADTSIPVAVTTADFAPLSLAPISEFADTTKQNTDIQNNDESLPTFAPQAHDAEEVREMDHDETKLSEHELEHQNTTFAGSEDIPVSHELAHESSSQLETARDLPNEDEPAVEAEVESEHVDQESTLVDDVHSPLEEESGQWWQKELTSHSTENNLDGDRSLDVKHEELPIPAADPITHDHETNHDNDSSFSSLSLHQHMVVDSASVNEPLEATGEKGHHVLENLEDDKVSTAEPIHTMIEEHNHEPVGEDHNGPEEPDFETLRFRYLPTTVESVVTDGASEPGSYHDSKDELVEPEHSSLDELASVEHPASEAQVPVENHESDNVSIELEHMSLNHRDAVEPHEREDEPESEIAPEVINDAADQPAEIHQSIPNHDDEPHESSTSQLDSCDHDVHTQETDHFPSESREIEWSVDSNHDDQVLHESADHAIDVTFDGSVDATETSEHAEHSEPIVTEHDHLGTALDQTAPNDLEHEPTQHEVEHEAEYEVDHEDDHEIEHEVEHEAEHEDEHEVHFEHATVPEEDAHVTEEHHEAVSVTETAPALKVAEDMEYEPQLYDAKLDNGLEHDAIPEDNASLLEYPEPTGTEDDLHNDPVTPKVMDSLDQEPQEQGVEIATGHENNLVAEANVPGLEDHHLSIDTEDHLPSTTSILTSADDLKSESEDHDPQVQAESVHDIASEGDVQDLEDHEYDAQPFAHEKLLTEHFPEHPQGQLDDEMEEASHLKSHDLQFPEHSVETHEEDHHDSSPLEDESKPVDRAVVTDDDVIHTTLDESAEMPSSKDLDEPSDDVLTYEADEIPILSHGAESELIDREVVLGDGDVPTTLVKSFEAESMEDLDDESHDPAIPGAHEPTLNPIAEGVLLETPEDNDTEIEDLNPSESEEHQSEPAPDSLNIGKDIKRSSEVLHELSVNHDHVVSVPDTSHSFAIPDSVNVKADDTREHIAETLPEENHNSIVFQDSAHEEEYNEEAQECKSPSGHDLETRSQSDVELSIPSSHPVENIEDSDAAADEKHQIEPFALTQSHIESVVSPSNDKLPTTISEVHPESIPRDVPISEEHIDHHDYDTEDNDEFEDTNGDDVNGRELSTDDDFESAFSRGGSVSPVQDFGTEDQYLHQLDVSTPASKTFHEGHDWHMHSTVPTSNDQDEMNNHSHDWPEHTNAVDESIREESEDAAGVTNSDMPTQHFPVKDHSAFASEAILPEPSSLPLDGVSPSIATEDEEPFYPTAPISHQITDEHDHHDDVVAQLPHSAQPEESTSLVEGGDHDSKKELQDTVLVQSEIDRDVTNQNDAILPETSAADVENTIKEPTSTQDSFHYATSISNAETAAEDVEAIHVHNTAVPEAIHHVAGAGPVLDEAQPEIKSTDASEPATDTIYGLDSMPKHDLAHEVPLLSEDQEIGPLSDTAVEHTSMIDTAVPTTHAASEYSKSFATSIQDQRGEVDAHLADHSTEETSSRQATPLGNLKREMDTHEPISDSKLATGSQPVDVFQFLERAESEVETAYDTMDEGSLKDGAPLNGSTGPLDHKTSQDIIRVPEHTPIAKPSSVNRSAESSIKVLNTDDMSDDTDSDDSDKSQGEEESGADGEDEDDEEDEEDEEAEDDDEEEDEEEEDESQNSEGSDGEDQEEDEDEEIDDRVPAVLPSKVDRSFPHVIQNMPSYEFGKPKMVDPFSEISHDQIDFSSSHRSSGLFASLVDTIKSDLPASKQVVSGGLRSPRRRGDYNPSMIKTPLQNAFQKTDTEEEASAHDSFSDRQPTTAHVRSHTADTVPPFDAHSDAESSISETPSSPFQETTREEPFIASGPHEQLAPISTDLKAEASPMRAEFDSYGTPTYPRYITSKPSHANLRSPIPSSGRSPKTDRFASQSITTPRGTTSPTTRRGSQPAGNVAERPYTPSRSLSYRTPSTPPPTQTRNHAPTQEGPSSGPSAPVLRRTISESKQTAGGRITSPSIPTNGYFQKTRSLFEATATGAAQALPAVTRPVSGHFNADSRASPQLGLASASTMEPSTYPTLTRKPSFPTSLRSRPSSFLSYRERALASGTVSPIEMDEEGEEGAVQIRSLDDDGKPPSPSFIIHPDSLPKRKSSVEGARRGSTASFEHVRKGSVGSMNSMNSRNSIGGNNRGHTSSNKSSFSGMTRGFAGKKSAEAEGFLSGSGHGRECEEAGGSMDG